MFKLLKRIWDTTGDSKNLLGNFVIPDMYFNVTKEGRVAGFTVGPWDHTYCPRIQPDFAVSVGYKWLMGPYGLGYMYVSKKWQETGEPLEYSWLTKKGSENFANLTNYVTGYREGARKFDMGEFPQFNLIPMSIAALQQIGNWEIDAVQSALKKLTDKIIAFKKQVGIFDETALGVGHISSIPLNNLNANKVKNRLQINNVVISFRGTSIRVSPHLYNDFEDIDKLLSCLRD